MRSTLVFGLLLAVTLVVMITVADAWSVPAVFVVVIGVGGFLLRRYISLAFDKRRVRNDG